MRAARECSRDSAKDRKLSCNAKNWSSSPNVVVKRQGCQAFSASAKTQRPRALLLPKWKSNEPWSATIDRQYRCVTDRLIGICFLTLRGSNGSTRKRGKGSNIEILETGGRAWLSGSRSACPQLSWDPHRGVTHVSLLHGPFNPLGANFQSGLIDEQPAVGGAEDDVGFAVAVEVGDGGGDGALGMAGAHVDGADGPVLADLKPGGSNENVDHTVAAEVGH